MKNDGFYAPSYSIPTYCSNKGLRMSCGKRLEIVLRQGGVNFLN